ncbi:hypothetical protein LguiB_026218 [Lonicera macranthoides]
MAQNSPWALRFAAHRKSKHKKERTMEWELPLIPDEIIDNILLRLPVKSLLRFKCVSKRWLSTISDPNFHHKKEYESILVAELLKTPTITVSLYSIDDDGSKVVKDVDKYSER